MKVIPGKVSVHHITLDLNTKKISEDTTVNLRRSQVKKDSSQPVDAQYTATYMQPYASREAIRSFFEQNVHFYRCVKLLELCVFKIGFNVVPRDGDQKDYLNDPEYKKITNFLEKPVNNVGETFEDVVGGWGCDYNMFGDSYLEVVRSKAGELSELYNLRAYNTRIGYDGRFKKNFADGIYFVQLLKNAQGKRFRLFGTEGNNTENEVLWLKNYNPFDRFYGFPHIYPAIPDLALDKAQKEFNLKEFTNDMMISFVIIVEGGELDDSAMRSIQEFLTSNYKGVANAGKVLLLSTDSPDVKIKIEKVSKENRDSSYDKLYDRCRDATMIAFGVLAPLLGTKTPGSLGNASELEVLFRFFDETIVKPDKRKSQAVLTHLLRNTLGIENYKFEWKEMTYEKFIDMVAFARDLTIAGLIDENEGRQYLGYQPRTDNDPDLSKLEKALRQIHILKKQIEEYMVAA